MKKNFIVHKRLLDVLQFYKTTFIGFCELINNSLQANANDIQVTVVETPDDDVSASPIQRIILRDNGTGVPPSEITPRLLHVATDVKPDGKGVGRFAALQIGKLVKITTVGKELSDGSKHPTKLAFSNDELSLFTARQVIFPLLDRVLATGHLDELAEQVLNLKPEVAQRLKGLLEDVDLEQVVSFSDAVARKVKVLDLLNEILYGAPADYITERKELHKLVERDLWLFGEQYAGPTILLSDKSLRTNLEVLRNEHFRYEPDSREDNIEAVPHPSLKLITDLFFFNERICDDGAREVMVVELKAPSVRLSQKEVDN